MYVLQRTPVDFLVRSLDSDKLLAFDAKVLLRQQFLTRPTSLPHITPHLHHDTHLQPPPWPQCTKVLKRRLHIRGLLASHFAPGLEKFASSRLFNRSDNEFTGEGFRGLVEDG